MTLNNNVTVNGGTGCSAFHIGTSANRLVANLVNNAGNTSIDVNVTGTDFPLWKGAQSTEWSTAILGPAKNWVLNTNNATGTDFLVSDNVVFSDVATGTAVNVSVADVAPASVLFSNVTKDCVVSGTKAIVGATGLTVSGGGKVALGTVKSFTGAVALNAGSVGSAVVLNGTLTSSGTSSFVRLNPTGPQTYTALGANAGVTNVHSPVGTGSATVNANAAVHFYTSQTLASLTIADGVEVTLGDGLAFAGEPEKLGAPAVVPEPDSAVLLLGGVGTLLGLRRRRAERRKKAGRPLLRR